MTIRNLLLLLSLAALWGPSFLFIKVAVNEIPALTLVCGRVSGAALILFLVLKLRRISLPPFGRIWIHFAAMAFFANAFPFVLITWGEIYIDSALAAILNGTTPLFTIVLAHLLIRDDRMTPARTGGISLGFIGLLFLIGPDISSGATASVSGIMAVAIASASYGWAMVYGRKYLTQLPPLVAPTAQLLLASVYMIPLSLALEQPFAMPMPSIEALGSLIALAIFGTAIAFVVYYRILEKAGATYLSTVTYLLPVIGVILGIAVLGERVRWNAFVGCALILCGIMLVNGAFGRNAALGKPSNLVRTDIQEEIS